MKVGIIGSGDVGQSLAKGLVNAGHEVMMGTRETSRKELVKLKETIGKKFELGTTTEAAKFGEICILAVAWHAGDDVIAQIRPQLAGKIVIDVTNPLVFNDGSSPELALGHTISGGEMVQQSLPDSHVVKALNTINHQNMVKPQFKSGVPTMFICGNNKSAVSHVSDILKQLGWDDVIDLGGIEKSRLLEPLCLLWVEVGILSGSWDHGFSVLRG